MADQAYQTSSFRFDNKGITARYTNDRLPPTTYMNLENLESQQEGSLTTRLGITPLTLSSGPTASSPLAGQVISLGRMLGLNTSYRYASAGGFLYRAVGDGPQVWSKITVTAVLSGKRMSMAAYRPNANANPYMFFADANVLLKDNGTGNAQKWGIAPPYIPPQLQIGDPGKVIIDNFDEADTSSFTFVGATSPTNVNRIAASMDGSGLGISSAFLELSNISQFVRAGGVTTATCDNTHGMVPGMRVAVTKATDQTFNAPSAVVTTATPTAFSYSNPGPDTILGGQAAVGDPSPSLIPGMLLTVNDGVNTETVMVLSLALVNGLNRFTANFKFLHNNGTPVTGKSVGFTVAAATTATCSKPASLDLSKVGTSTIPDNDFIQLSIQCVNPLNVAEIRILFDVGNGQFSQDYYYKSINPATYQPAVSGNKVTGDVQTDRIAARAAARADARRVGVVIDDLVPTDLVDLRPLRPAELNTGLNAWSVIQVRKSEFVKVGAAGSVTNDWSKVVAWRIQVKSSPNASSTIFVDDLMLVGGADLDAFNGQPYDYRYTYYNLNTGAESNPSITLLSQYFLSPRRQPIQINWTASPDPQVTHVRIYRRGGLLTQTWYLVTQIAIGTTQYTDVIADTSIEVNPTIRLDNDPPVSSTLRTPVNTTVTAINVVNFQGGLLVAMTVADATNIFTGQKLTVGTSVNQETAYVNLNAGGNVIQLFLQNPHPNGDPVTATKREQIPLPFMALAFDKMWLAGDPDNPHVLYYSNPFNPESFPVTNSLEIGTPDAPIRALIAKRGILLVATTKSWYQVLGAGSAVPIVLPTGIKHGLIAPFAWANSEDFIFYLSYDGLYITDVSAAQYFTRDTEWLWTNKSYGPIPPIPTTQMVNVFMGFSGRSVYVSYVDGTGKAHRLIYDNSFQRWRNDDAANDITAMNGEDDTGALIIGKVNGMVYQDRQGTQDIDNYIAGVAQVSPITFNLQTIQNDLSEAVAKMNKVFNELTLDWDTNGQAVSVTLIFDNGTSQLALGTFTQAGRGQTQININAGAGRRSQNIGLLVTGSVTQPVTFYECHIRAIIEAEFRRSWDTYKLVFGTPEFKLIKQGWFVYRAPDPGGIVVNAYTEDAVTPTFSFTLPQSMLRRSARVRFPATKFKIIRFTGTSAGDFQMHADSELEVKPVCSGKGYSRQPFQPGIA